MKQDGMKCRIASLFLLAALAVAGAQEGRRIEPAWERALGGDAASPPVAYRGRVYVLSIDRSITCLSETGGFVWRKALRNRPAPRFAVTKGGLVSVFGRNGEMTAFSANGRLLWTYSGKKGSLPVLNPYAGRDGRLFILYEDEMVCLASNGAQKWRSSMDGSGAQMICDDGRGNALVIKADGAVVPVSPYGTVYPAVETGLDIRQALPLEGNASALFVPDSSSGYKVLAADFNPEGGGNEINVLWESGGLPQLAAAASFGGAIYYAGTDGRLFVIGSSDGAIRSETSFYARGPVSGASLFFDPSGDGGRIILLAQEMCIAFSLEGDVLWQAAFSKPLLNPVFTENGYAVSAPQNSVITAYRVDASPGRSIELEAHSPEQASYGIFEGKSLDYRNPEAVTFSYFEGVRKKINEGNLGEDEKDISRRLAEILNNDTGRAFPLESFDDSLRSLAATLLGKMGSEEARGILLAAAKRETSPTVIAGILRGLSSLGPEDGRETFDAVMLVSRQHGRQEEIAALACDTLLSIAKSSYGDIADEAVAAIYSYTGAQYSAATRKYAAQMVEKLLE